MTTYPPAPLALQNKLALDNELSQIAYVGYEGTIFQLSGPFAPLMGAQTGAVITNIAHIDPPFKHLDNKGARQDGVTWYDSLYAIGEIDLSIELGALSASEMRKIIAKWLGAWDPKKLGKLCWFSPERGEWFCNVRMNKPIPDTFAQDWYQSRRVKFTWSCRNDDSFWQGVDSVCNYTADSNVINEPFNFTDVGLGADWSQTNTGPGNVQVTTAGQASWNTSGTTDGVAVCRHTGEGGVSGSDNQFISVTLLQNMPALSNAVQTVTINGSPTGGTFTLTYAAQTTAAIAYNAPAATVQSALEALSSIGTGNVTVTGNGPYTVTFIGTLGSQAIANMTATGALTGGTTPSVSVATTGTGGVGAYIDVFGRMDTAGNNRIRARFGYSTISLDFFHGGVLTNVWNGSLATPPKAGDVLTLQCGLTEPAQSSLKDLFSGTNYNPRQFQVLINHVPQIVDTGWSRWVDYFFGTTYGYVDTSTSSLGYQYRGWGFGMVASGTGITQVTPPTISLWSGGSDTGFIKLTNIGDQPSWPRYLCYGPGTFLIGDGPGSDTMISFGPLLDGQVALLTTLPRLQGVTDVTPPAQSQTQYNFWNQLSQGPKGMISQIINFVTNNNVPPLLQQFESLFGITPPQGPLYSLLNGRFTNSIDQMLEHVGPVESHIPIQIQGGSSKSKVIAALTPYRRWPE